MNETRKILRHFLAALAYRTQKALRDAPASFGDFQAGNGTRTPAELLAHMNMLIGYARTFFIGGEAPPEDPTNLRAGIARFHEELHNLSSDLQSPMPLDGVTYEQLLQGPLTDAMTHAGQLAMLRRLAGDPVEAENFVVAEIETDNVSSNQPAAR
jgi:hypothetical protein